MPKASIIIPVYNAQKTLRKCVESIVFGQEQDVEIILVEDRSKDGSWELCKQLESAYPQVRAVQNERNSGPSFTRNRGLDEATGRYVLFVDSDDWVSGAYTKKLLDAQAMHSDRLVICGYAFLDYVSDRRRTYGVCENGDETRTLPGDAYFSLVDEILIQQLWNKVFERKIIQEKGIRFDVDLSMGEDFQFVIDYLREAKVDGCVVINAPLYYYTRRSKGSLMSRWAELSTLEQSIGRLRQVETICGNHSAAKGPIENTRNQFAGRVVSDRKLTKAEKLQQLEAIW
jgi:glycosyltransferase involved in cell wall biosynthesis